MDPQGNGLDHVFANLTGHDPVSGAKLVSDDDVPKRKPNPVVEETEQDDENEYEEEMTDEANEDESQGESQ